MNKYQPTIGLEAHVELNTKSKMFCGCRNNPEAKIPNSEICPICMGHPGTLPIINEEAVKKVIKTGLALNCQIPKYSRFDRKCYFYPDLPKGYQISQYDFPLSKQGHLEIPRFEESGDKNRLKITVQNSKLKKIRIKRIHLEEDTAKLIHPEGKDYSLVDFNRAGTPLMEIVTEPDITSAKDAKKFAEELRLILRYLEVSDADMEKGQFRVEANISLTKTKKYTLYRNGISDAGLGVKVEIKNLNSFKAVERGIEYEIKRQREILESGKKVIQETRGWDENKEMTVSQRIKEEAHDYRYFPEPDLPILKSEDATIDKIKTKILELPQQKRKRFEEEYGLPDNDVEILTANKLLANFFENVCSEIPQTEYAVGKKELPFQKLYKLAANYLITEIPRQQFNSFKITPENFAEFITLIYRGIISSSGAQILLKEMLKTGTDPTRIIEIKNLTQVVDKDEIKNIIQKVIIKNSKAVEDYKKGKQGALQFIIGQVMIATKGKANPQMVNDILKKELDSPR